MTSATAPSPEPFPQGGRRLVIFVVYDRRGEVDSVVLRALQGLRVHASEIHVVVNGTLTEPSRALLETAADRVTVRGNHGYDIGAQREALAELGEDVARFDEVLLTNDTWYGPLDDFDDLFQRMDRQPLDFWGLTAHGAADGFPRHLQSYWLAARRSLVDTAEWRSYWAELPPITEYWDAVLGHEIAFTDHFEKRGFTSGVAFDETAYPPGNATIFAPAQLVADGCPVVKKRIFFHDPIHLARQGVRGRDVLAAAVQAGYPADLLWHHLARTVPPMTLQASCGEIHVTTDLDATRTSVGRTLVIAHVGGTGDVKALAVRLAGLPSGWELILTGATAASVPDPAALFSAAEKVTFHEVPESDADGVVAFFEACSSLDLDRWDVILAVRAPITDPTAPLAARERDRGALDALLGTAEARATPLDAFTDPAPIGSVFPLAGLAGTAAEDALWGEERIFVEQIRSICGIRVPWEEDGPLEPAEGMWAMRPAVIRPLVDPRVGAALADAQVELRGRALRRSIASSAGELGLHVRVVNTAQALAASTSLRGAGDLSAGAVARNSSHAVPAVASSEAAPPSRTRSLARRVRDRSRRLVARFRSR